VALIGCGAIAHEAHLVSIYQIPFIELMALVDSSETALKESASKYNLPAECCYENIDALLKSEKEFDAAVICTPASTHCEIAVKCLEGGKHIFVEKPIAPTLNEASKMVKSARAQGKVLMVGHYLRYMPHHLKARAMINGGEIGKICAAFAYEETLGIKPEEGIITDLAPHYVDLMCFYFDGARAERVYATASRVNASANNHKETEAEIKIFFSNGAVANIMVFWVPGFKNWDACERYMRFVGTDGYIKVGMTSSLIQTYKAKTLLGRMRGAFSFVPKFVLHPDMPIKGTAFRKELEDFAKAILNGAEPPISGETAMETVRILEAALKSARNYTEEKIEKN
jgi:predicted dehydrogenase